MQRIIVSVSNDLDTDQRVKKICQTLFDLGYEVILIGRLLPNSESLKRPYQTHRMQLFFNKGFLFYAELNIRLFFKLLFGKPDILLSNDLDTLLPNFLIHKILKIKLVYDSHELFTEIPELNNRPGIKEIWTSIEKSILPNVKNMYTVNSQIAAYYHTKYKIPVQVIRNLPYKQEAGNPEKAFKDRIKQNRKMIVLQGTGLNMDRGAEEAVLMMQFLQNTVLYIIGGGDVFDKLAGLIKDHRLEDKVFLLKKMPYEKLMEYTSLADLGLSLDKNTNLNYEWSLPNKLFDYVRCRVPVLVSDRKLVAKFVKNNEIGFVTKTFDPMLLAQTVSSIFADEKTYQIWKENLDKIAPEYTWENESEKLIKIFNNLV